MKISVPRKNLKEMTLYVWKIIEYSQISKKELLYKLTFDLSLFTPDEAHKYIKEAQDNNLIIENDDNILTIAPELEKILKNWQRKRKDEILNQIESSKNAEKIRARFQKDKTSTYNILLKAFLDKGTLNRAVNVSDDSINLSLFDLNKGKINAHIIGSRKNPYIIEIDIKKRSLKHDCQDFVTKRLDNKKFCKHLAKLFLFLKEKDENAAKRFLEAITENIEQWDFLN
ncbi:MAG: DUF2240 family protein [Promethearchaeota archaeon]